MKGAVLPILALLIVCVIGAAQLTAWDHCRQRGGAYVRSLFGYTCVRAIR